MMDADEVRRQRIAQLAVQEYQEQIALRMAQDEERARLRAAVEAVIAAGGLIIDYGDGVPYEATRDGRQFMIEKVCGWNPDKTEAEALEMVRAMDSRERGLVLTNAHRNEWSASIWKLRNGVAVRRDGSSDPFGTSDYASDHSLLPAKTPQAGVDNWGASMPRCEAPPVSDSRRLFAPVSWLLRG